MVQCKTNRHAESHIGPLRDEFIVSYHPQSVDRYNRDTPHWCAHKTRKCVEATLGYPGHFANFIYFYLRIANNAAFTIARRLISCRSPEFCVLFMSLSLKNSDNICVHRESSEKTDGQIDWNAFDQYFFHPWLVRLDFDYKFIHPRTVQQLFLRTRFERAQFHSTDGQ